MKLIEKKNQYEILSVQRALSVLSAFHQNQKAMSLSEICKATRLSKSTAFRLVVNLQQQGFLVKNEVEKYTPGPEIERLASFADGSLELRRLAYPYISFLSEVTKETVLLTKLKKDCLYCIDKIESYHVLRIASQVGIQVTMLRGVTGTSVVAFLDDFARQRIMENEKRFHYFGEIKEQEVIHAERLEAIRVQGFALSQGEVDAGVVAIAAPFFDSEHTVYGSISILGPSIRFTPVDAIYFEQLLRLCCRRISRGQIFTEEFRREGLELTKRIYTKANPD